MINYIIQLIIYQSLFMLFYEVFLKKETFFQWNRVYLLVSSLIAYIIPFIHLKKVPEIILKSDLYPIMMEQFYVSNTISIATNQTTKTSLISLENGYYIGFSIMLLLFAIKLTQIVSKVKTGEVIKKQIHNIVILKEENKAFTFFKYIFLSKNFYESQNTQILKHELVHVKEKHSIDLLFFEVQKILFWFNPLVYIYQKKITIIHEYIADNKSVKNKTAFFESLLNQTFQVQNLSIVNNYNKKSILKKRIMMATKNKSKQVLKMKYLILLPLVFTMLIITSCNAQKDEKQEVTESIPFAIIEKSPIYPGCEEFTNQEDLKKCFKNSITNHIVNDFDYKMAENLGLASGKKRIAVQFIIEKDGSVSNIKSRAPHQKLKEEAIRIIKLLPIMKPAKIDGKPVKMRFNIPIMFEIK